MKPLARLTATTFTRSGSARVNVAAVVLPAVTPGPRGGSAPAVKLLGLLVLSLIALSVTATSALAVPPTVLAAPEVSEVSYTSVHLKGEITSDGTGLFAGTTYKFQYSIDPETEGWTTGFSELVSGAFTGKKVDGPITGLKGATKYFVRLTASATHIGDPEPIQEGVSPLPNPSFTTLAVDPPTIPGAVEASPVFSTSATARAKVKRPANPDSASDVSCRFEYISDAQFEENLNVSSQPGFTGASSVACTQNPIGEADAGVEKEVTANLPNLSPSTTYHLRLVAEDGAPGVVTKAAANFTTTTKVAAPSVLATDDATEVSYFTAKVSGEVRRPAGADPALDINCNFEYVTDEQFDVNEANSLPGFEGAGAVGCLENPITAATAEPDGTQMVSAELSGLQAGPAGTTYHLRLTAASEGGTANKEAAHTFTTTPSKEPILEVNPVLPTEVGYTTAHVTATIDRGEPERNLSAYNFEIFTDPNTPEAGGPSCCAVKPGKKTEYSTGADVIEHPDFSNLTPGTTYYVRLTTFSDTEAETFLFSPKPYESFTTKGTSAPPIVNFDPITNFTGTTASFTGTVDPNAPAEALSADGKAAYETDWHIECTPECKDAHEHAIGGTIEGDGGAQSVAGDFKRLEPDTEYEVKLVAHNFLGTVESVGTFRTLKILPSVKQAPGASDGKGGYDLQGVVNPNNHTVTGCKFEWGPTAPKYAFSADCSPMPSGGAKPQTVEAHLTGLSPGVDYHALLVVTYDAVAKAEGVDQKFKATLSAAEPCPANEQLRVENSSLALPECRAYEQVSSPFKEGYEALLVESDEGSAVQYDSKAPNIVNSGTGIAPTVSPYVATRTAVGWKTIPDLNGPSGSMYASPSDLVPGSIAGWHYSQDLLTSIWDFARPPEPQTSAHAYFRHPNGTFSLIGNGMSVEQFRAPYLLGASADLSHVVYTPASLEPTTWGPGVYEFIGTGNDQPRRVDVDNLGEAASECVIRSGGLGPISAEGKAVSTDGRAIAFAIGGDCGGANPPADQVWVRIDGTISIDASASHCTRTAPAEPCNPPAGANFAFATPDGSRVFFTTTQQLVNGDTDQTNDLYACDIPAGTPVPTARVNPCPTLTEVSGSSGKADLELPSPGVHGQIGSSPAVLDVSEDGSTAYFVSPAVLAANKDALGETAVAGERNLYVWRQDPADPAGVTKFIAAFPVSDTPVAQATPDGRYLILQTNTQLLVTDTDGAADVYRYDVDTEDLNRVSTALSGTGGNGEGLDASVDVPRDGEFPTFNYHSNPTVSDDGKIVVFETSENLSPLDENGEPDLYLWKSGRVSLITSGSVHGGSIGPFAVSGSGQDVYFGTEAQLSPSDGDGNKDVYDARIGGGFSFAQNPCSGEACQPEAHVPSAPKSLGSQAPGPGNPSQSKPCPKGKVRKHGKCVKKPSKKHSGKKASANKGSHKQGGGR